MRVMHSVRECDVVDCDGRHKAKGLCNKHYRRLSRRGSISERGRYHAPPLERVMRNTQSNGECIEFMGARNSTNYGLVRVDRKTWLAHRVVAAEIHGLAAIEGMAVCHTCDNPPCVNPDHLFIGTLSDNAFDRERKGRGRDITGSNNPNWKEISVSCTL